MIRFGADGWRARYGDGFDDQGVVSVSSQIAEQFAREGSSGLLYVGYDTRRDARHYARLVADAVAAWGFDVVLSQAHCPLATLSWATSHDARSAGAIMVTAGHNDANWNGIKVCASDGNEVSEEFSSAIQGRLGSGSPSEPPAGLDKGEICERDIVGPYLASIADVVDANAIARAGMTVVHDPLYGASRTYFSSLLSDMGATVKEIHGFQLDDFGGMEPDPCEQCSAGCKFAVKDEGAWAGFVNGADATRISAVDEQGNFVSPDKLAALLLEHLSERHHLSGRVVVTDPTSIVVRRQAKRLGYPLTVVPVGSHWVSAEMARGDVLLCLQETGSIALPFHLRERDGIFAGILLCEMMATSGKRLGELVSELERQVGHMEYAKRNLKLDPGSTQIVRNMLPGINPQRIAGMEPAAVDHSDGLRLRFEDDAWLLIRPSNTLPYVRVYAEAPSAEERDHIIADGCELLRSDLNLML
jgi:phosphomannomutase